MRVVVTVALLAVIGCGEDGASGGECVASHLAPAPDGEAYVAWLGTDLVPKVGRLGGGVVRWADGAAWPTRALVASDTRVAHLAGTGRLRLWDPSGRLVHQRDLTGEGLCDVCGGLAFAGDLATLWLGALRWVTASGEDAGVTPLPDVAEGWCACSLAALPAGDLLVSGMAPGEIPTSQVLRLQRDGTELWRWEAPEGHVAQVASLSSGEVVVFGEARVREGRYDGWVQRLSAAGQPLGNPVLLTVGEVGWVSFVAEHASGDLRLGYVAADAATGEQSLYLLGLAEDGTLTSATADAEWQDLVPLPGGTLVAGLRAAVPRDAARTLVGCGPLPVTDYPDL